MGKICDDLRPVVSVEEDVSWCNCVISFVCGFGGAGFIKLIGVHLEEFLVGFGVVVCMVSVGWSGRGGKG